MDREERYILANVGNNNNKFWNISQNGTAVTTHWGRVGDTGQSKTFPHSSTYSAESFFESKCREKERKGYVKQRVLIDSTPNIQVVQASSLEAVARAQIKTNNSPELDELVKFLTKTNIHNIMSATTMQYDDTSGVFKTPLGIVTSDAITDARDLLVKMGDLVFKQDYDNSTWNSLLSSYLVTIPQNIGRTRPDPRVLFPDLNAIQAQGKILDDLDASLQSVLSGAVIKDDKGNEVKDAPQVFDVSLSIVNDGRIIDHVRNKYDATRNRMHACNHLKVRRVFTVEIGVMSSAYNQRGKKIGNIMQLWHGTRVGNLLSILKGGLRVPPASSPHVTGRLFGDGVYFSDQSTKALNYAYGAAPGQRGGLESATFMFLADVAMGTAYTPQSYNRPHSYPVQGHHSTFAKANVSGVMNNEMIVYSTDQCNLTYLIEFGN